MKERILSKFHDQNDLKTNKKVYIAILDSLILIIFSVILTISGLELIKLSPHYNELNTTLNEERNTCYDITSESKLYTYIEDENNEKTDLEEAYDTSLIPMPFAEQLLVYGACLRLKANPQYFKFSYWLSMYKEALLNLKSKTSVSALSSPVVNLFRK